MIPKDLNPIAIPVVGTITYEKIDANSYKRRRVVEDTVMLKGSSMSLEKQIQAVDIRLAAIDEIDYSCGCTFCLEQKEMTDMEKADLDKEKVRLLAEWKKVTSGKDYSEE